MIYMKGADNLEVITYSLKNGEKSSDEYYRAAATFTDEVLLESEAVVGELVSSFGNYVEAVWPQNRRTREEYILEVLLLGTLWRIYSDDSPFTPEHMERLLKWLSSTGDFTQEVKRLEMWKEFLASRTPEEVTDYLASAVTFAVWFEVRSEDVLGCFTSNVERFLREVLPRYNWREDVIFCGRRRVEYHLNMVGAELMNRAFRKSFANTGKKAVLLPACMCLQPEEECKAYSANPGLKCAGCSEACRVNQLAKLGEIYGFSVLVIPHQSSVYPDPTKNPAIDNNTGVIGVACVINLLGGGWMLKDLGIPAQCVLLDYCGCRNHWHEKGIPTEINVARLLDIIGADEPNR